MSRSAPVLTVRSSQSQGSFAGGRDVVVGSDQHSDLRIAHPVVARAHLLLRFGQDGWVAVDNDTHNGIYVSGERVPTVEIEDGLTINIGKPDGPRITFEVRQHRGGAGMPEDDYRAPAPTRLPGASRKFGSRPRRTQPRHTPPSGQPPESA
jgi:ABC transport system ATP-binding/permease protein